MPYMVGSETVRLKSRTNAEGVATMYAMIRVTDGLFLYPLRVFANKSSMAKAFEETTGWPYSEYDEFCAFGDGDEGAKNLHPESEWDFSADDYLRCIEVNCEDEDTVSFITKWQSGAEIRSGCEVDMETREIKNIKNGGNPPDDDSLIEECVEIDGKEFSAMNLDELLATDSDNLLDELEQIKEDPGMFWYSLSGRILDQEIASAKKERLG